jgi:hypothetical protein
MLTDAEIEEEREKKYGPIEKEYAREFFYGPLHLGYLR